MTNYIKSSTGTTISTEYLAALQVRIQDEFYYISAEYYDIRLNNYQNRLIKKIKGINAANKWVAGWNNKNAENYYLDWYFDKEESKYIKTGLCTKFIIRLNHL